MKIVYVTGKAGIGKTNLSIRLQEKYKWKRLEIDELTILNRQINYPETKKNYEFIDKFVERVLPDFIDDRDILIVDHLITIKPAHRKKFEILNPEEEVMVIVEHEDHEERYRKGHGEEIPTEGKWYDFHIAPMEGKYELPDKVWRIKNDEADEKVVKELGEYLS